jgi:hypothetical protein
MRRKSTRRKSIVPPNMNTQKDESELNSKNGKAGEEFQRRKSRFADVHGLNNI